MSLASSLTPLLHDEENEQEAPMPDQFEIGKRSWKFPLPRFDFVRLKENLSLIAPPRPNIRGGGGEERRTRGDPASKEDDETEATEKFLLKSA